jgi:hypothetical protein
MGIQRPSLISTWLLLKLQLRQHAFATLRWTTFWTLEHSLHINNGIMRSHFLRLGFKDLEHLCKQDKGYAKRICASIKKLPGVEAARSIPEDTEGLLNAVLQWV